MKKTKRRDFLKQFFWGSALLYVNPITFSTSGKAITDKANNLPTDEITRKQALTYFYKKEYKNAENLFNLKSASNLNGNLNCSKELEHYAS